ncbi:hypothetical protein Ssi02_48440 [Sinosporangium siamense]|uniref:Uncharacterized protein n=1 Tax=Sinosporangium siamense TaxID=1367973 RepID=A0A919RJ66_9ACTN|nr:hypothetical protein Ssi02_48440 [Sinosporangium siamense]
MRWASQTPVCAPVSGSVVNPWSVIVSMPFCALRGCAGGAEVWGIELVPRVEASRVGTSSASGGGPGGGSWWGVGRGFAPLGERLSADQAGRRTSAGLVGVELYR